MSAGRWVQDAQPPHPYDRRAQLLAAFIVGPSMNQAPEHAFDQITIWVLAVETQDPGDPTHVDP